MKVLIITTIKAPYRTDLFEELGKSINLTVFFEQSFDKTREENWLTNNFSNFNALYMNSKSNHHFKKRIYDEIKKNMI